MTPPSSATLVRLVAAREIATRLRDKNFIVGSVVLIGLIVGLLAFQIAIAADASQTRLGVVGSSAALDAALVAQGDAVGLDLTVVDLADEDAARAAVRSEDVDAALLAGAAANPQLVALDAPDTQLEVAVGGAVSGLAVEAQLAAAGVTIDVPTLKVTALEPGDEGADQRIVVATIGVALLYGLLILFGQFVAQGVVEEKASRVVEVLLSTMKAWQLLAGKIIGLGLLALAQLVVIVAIGVTGALVADLVDVPGELIGTAASVIAWFVLGYAFYASVFAVAASLVSRQEDLGSVLTPATVLLIAGFIIAVQSSSDPGGTLATVTSYLPGLSPLVMPVRQAAGEAGPLDVAIAVVLMLVAIGLLVRLGGRAYAGALLRTSGKTKLREALRAERG